MIYLCSYYDKGMTNAEVEQRKQELWYSVRVGCERVGVVVPCCGHLARLPRNWVLTICLFDASFFYSETTLNPFSKNASLPFVCSRRFKETPLLFERIVPTCVCEDWSLFHATR